MNTLKLEAELAKLYNYKKLPDNISQLCRDTYRKNIPKFLSIDGGNKLYTLHGTLLTSRYNRIVIGDYGAFVEFTEPNLERMIIQSGEEYRLRSDYKNIKYDWYTIDDYSDIKIYYQKQTVDYADYKPGMYYVSVHEVLIEDNNE